MHSTNPYVQKHTGHVGQTHHKLGCFADSHNFAMCSAIELDLYAIKKEEENQLNINMKIALC